MAIAENQVTLEVVRDGKTAYQSFIDGLPEGTVPPTEEEFNSDLASVPNKVNIGDSNIETLDEILNLTESIKIRAEGLTEEQFNANKTAYYLLVDGEYAQCDDDSVFEPTATYYKDWDYISISKNDSMFETRIDNEEMGFYANGNKVAFVGIRSFQAQEIIIKGNANNDILSIGDFRVETHNTGSTNNLKIYSIGE